MKKYLSILLVAVLCGVIFTMFRRGGDAPLEPEIEDQSYRLNDSLYNALSDLRSTEKMEQYIRNWMARNAIRGASLAVMKNEHLVYCKGFGWADEERNIPAEVGIYTA